MRHKQDVFDLKLARLPVCLSVFLIVCLPTRLSVWQPVSTQRNKTIV